MSQDFVRQMPGQSSDLARRVGLWQRLHIDPLLLLLLLTLTVFGLVVLYSASGQSIDTLIRQGRFLLIAYVGMLVIAQFDVERIKRLAPLGYLIGIGLLIAVPLIGVGAKGAQRWLSLGGFRFQPSELMKLVLPMAVAWYFSTRNLPPRFKYILVSLGIVAVPTLLIAQQPDLGTSILIAASGIFVLFLSGIGLGFIFGAVGLAVLAAYPMWQYVLRDYQKQRILTMFNPESDKLGRDGILFSRKQRLAPEAGMVKVGLMVPNPIWNFCPRVILILSLRYWLKSGACKVYWFYW